MRSAFLRRALKICAWQAMLLVFLFTVIALVGPWRARARLTNFSRLQLRPPAARLRVRDPSEAAGFLFQFLLIRMTLREPSRERASKLRDDFPIQETVFELLTPSDRILPPALLRSC
jgi:hypothetical protein